ncbi:hypothetical protein DPMN_105721 [Dreissena polymorpha]|uniref:Uncharacterized protein n=1 Tax=Dreissena polymorpha TaxID=45954 RepID=A0A9D4K3R5_DREPO|nr:hypothetical protein DPMN_105721 [Dreissena polymorpha]
MVYAPQSRQELYGCANGVRSTVSSGVIWVCKWCKIHSLVRRYMECANGVRSTVSSGVIWVCKCSKIHFCMLWLLL